MQQVDLHSARRAQACPVSAGFSAVSGCRVVHRSRGITCGVRRAGRAADLGPCENLHVPAGSKLAFRVFAKGVQIYHWNGTSWSFDGPPAELSGDADGRAQSASIMPVQPGRA